MQFTFRLTNDEFTANRRLNKLIGIPRWKSLGIAFLCLLPSMLLVVLMESYLAILIFAVLGIFLIFIIALSALREKPLVDKHDHVLTLNEHCKHEKHSHSEFEVNWRHYDEFEETENSFLFRRLDRYVTIPKRAIPADKLAEFRSYCALVNQVQEPAEPDPPVPLFDRLFSNVDQSPIFRFSYMADDLANAALDPLRIVDTSQGEKPDRVNNGSMLAVLIAITVVLGFLLQTIDRPGAFWRWGQFLMFGAAIALPFVLLIFISKIFRSRSAKRVPRVPREEHQLVLLKNGLAIGCPASATLFDWRDVNAFYENKFCYGFQTFNELVQIIPKRIFSDETQRESFFQQAMGLHREYRRSFAPVATAVETGNPYQPPAI